MNKTKILSLVLVLALLVVPLCLSGCTKKTIVGQWQLVGVGHISEDGDHFIYDTPAEGKTASYYTASKVYDFKDDGTVLTDRANIKYEELIPEAGEIKAYQFKANLVSRGRIFFLEKDGYDYLYILGDMGYKTSTLRVTKYERI